MFEHSVKVPRHYKIAANIFKKVSTEGGSVKNLLYDDKLRHFRTNVLFALITETIKHAADLEKVFESCSLLKNESRFDPWLAKVLATELLFGKKALPGKSKPEQTILSYKEQFETFLKENSTDLRTKDVRRPRYVRINTNLLSTSDAIRAFQDEGYKFIRCTSGSYDDYLKQIQGLTEYDFTQDYHVKTVFVFAAGTKLHEHELYLESKIILQDKATAMAVHLLSPEPNSVILDMCAAPGMKTTQLAAFMRNEGKIYAVERNEKRYQTLCEFVERTGSKCVETLHKDALEIKRGDCDDVQYILLDPSCSGSGMELCVHNYIEEARLAKLTSLQEKFLKHAMNAFPKAKKIVYSTCSLFPEENERVITNVVKTSRAKWRVQDVKELLKGQWNNIGSGMYGSMGARCMYARPDTDFTTGFFLAVLERDAKDLERSLCKSVDGGISKADEEEKSKKKKKRKDNVQDVEHGEIVVEAEVVNKKKKRHYHDVNSNESTNNDFEESRKESVQKDTSVIENENQESNENKRKYKKKKKVKELEDMPVKESTNESNSVAFNEVNNTSESKTKREKKKDKRKTSELIFKDEENTNNVERSKKRRNRDEDVDQNPEPTKEANESKRKKKSNEVLEQDSCLDAEDKQIQIKKSKKKKSKQSLSES